MFNINKDVLKDFMFLNKRLPPDLQDDEIKQYSTILRKLLIEKSISTVWRNMEFKGEPCFLCNDLQSFLATLTQLPQQYIVVAGGASSSVNLYLRRTYLPLIFDIQHNSLDIKYFEKSAAKNNLFADNLKLSEFLLTSCILGYLSIPNSQKKQGAINSKFINRVNITREELIKYYCYVEGGTHLENIKGGNKKIEEKVDLLSQPLNNMQNSMRYITHVSVGIKNILAFELLGIIQSINVSLDIDKLKKKLLSLS